MTALLLIAALLQTVAEGETVRLEFQGADIELLDDVRHVAVHVEKIRGQKFSRPPIAVRAPESIRQAAAEIRAYNVLTRGRLEARGRAWSDVGLGGPRSPAVLLLALSADVGEIGFDPQGNRLLVSPARLVPRDIEPKPELDTESTVLMATGVRPDETLVAHMLMHVRQREREAGDSIAETTDELLARSAWAEGEANLVALRYLFQGMGLADDVLQVRLDPGQYLDGSLVSRSLDRISGAEARLVQFVYLEGFAEAVRVFKLGGWEALDGALQTRRTTHALLHPDRNPAPPPPIGAEPLDLPGWTLVDADTLGEQAIQALLSTLTDKENLALLGAQGWAGDRLERWEPGEPAGAADGVTRWFSSWSGDRAAGDFEYAFRRALETRFPGQPIVATGPSRWTLETPARVYRFERQGTRVRVLVAPPELDLRLRPAREPAE